MVITFVLRRNKADVLAQHVNKLIRGERGVHPMTREHFHKHHSAVAEDITSVRSFAAKHGLTILEVHAPRRLVVLSCTPEQLGAAEITRAAPIPKELVGVVLAVAGIDAAPMRRPGVIA